MKPTRHLAFSNGSCATSWMSANCDRCVKAARILDDFGRTTKCRCAIQSDIASAWLGDGMVSKRTYDIIQQWDCPNIQLHWKQYPKKDKFRNQPNLFDEV